MPYPTDHKKATQKKEINPKPIPKGIGKPVITNPAPKKK